MLETRALHFICQDLTDDKRRRAVAHFMRAGGRRKDDVKKPKSCRLLEREQNDESGGVRVRGRHRTVSAVCCVRLRSTA